MSSVARQNVLSRSSLQTNQRRATTGGTGKVRQGSAKLILTKDEKENKTIKRVATTQGNKDVDNARAKMSVATGQKASKYPPINGKVAESNRTNGPGRGTGPVEPRNAIETRDHSLVVSASGDKIAGVMEESGNEKMDTSIDVEIPSEKLRERELSGVTIERGKSKSAAKRQIPSKCDNPSDKKTNDRISSEITKRKGTNPLKSVKVEKVSPTACQTTTDSITKRHEQAPSLSSSARPSTKPNKQSVRKMQSIDESQQEVQKQNKPDSVDSAVKCANSGKCKSTKGNVSESKTQAGKAAVDGKKEAVDKRQGRSATFVKSSSDDRSVSSTRSSTKSRSTTPLSTSSTSSKTSGESSRCVNGDKKELAQNAKTHATKGSAKQTPSLNIGSETQTKISKAKTSGTTGSAKQDKTGNSAMTPGSGSRSTTPGSTSTSSEEGAKPGTGRVPPQSSPATSAGLKKPLTKLTKESDEKTRKVSVDNKKTAKENCGEIKDKPSTSSESKLKTPHTNIVKTRTSSTIPQRTISTRTAKTGSTDVKQPGYARQTSVTRSRSATPASMTSSTHSDVGASMKTTKTVNQRQTIKKTSVSVTDACERRLSAEKKLAKIDSQKTPTLNTNTATASELRKTTRTQSVEISNRSALPLASQTSTTRKTNKTSETQTSQLTHKSGDNISCVEQIAVEKEVLQPNSDLRAKENQVETLPIKDHLRPNKPINKTKQSRSKESHVTTKKATQEDHKSKIMSSAAKEVTDRLSNISKTKINTTTIKTRNEQETNGSSKKTTQTSQQNSFKKSVSRNESSSSIKKDTKNNDLISQSNTINKVLQTEEGNSTGCDVRTINDTITQRGSFIQSPYKGDEKSKVDCVKMMQKSNNKTDVKKQTNNNNKSVVKENASARRGKPPSPQHSNEQAGQSVPGPEGVNTSNTDMSCADQTDRNLSITIETENVSRALSGNMGLTGLADQINHRVIEDRHEGTKETREKSSDGHFTISRKSSIVKSDLLGSVSRVKSKQSNAVISGDVTVNKTKLSQKDGHKTVTKPAFLRSKTYVKASSLNKHEIQSNDKQSHEDRRNIDGSSGNVTPVSLYDSTDSKSSYHLKSSAPCHKIDTDCSKEFLIAQKTNENLSTGSTRSTNYETRDQEMSVLQYTDKDSNRNDTLTDGVILSDSENLRNLPLGVGCMLADEDLLLDSSHTSSSSITGADAAHQLADRQNKTSLSQFSAVIYADDKKDTAQISEAHIAARYYEQNGTPQLQQHCKDVSNVDNDALEMYNCERSSVLRGFNYSNEAVCSSAPRETIKYSGKTSSHHELINGENRLSSAETDTHSDKFTGESFPGLHSVCEFNSKTAVCRDSKLVSTQMRIDMESDNSDHLISTCDKIISSDSKLLRQECESGRNLCQFKTSAKDVDSEFMSKEEHSDSAFICSVEEKQYDHCRRDEVLNMASQSQTICDMTTPRNLDTSKSQTSVTTDKTIIRLQPEQGASVFPTPRDNLQPNGLNRTGQIECETHLLHEGHISPPVKGMKTKQFRENNNTQGRSLCYASVSTAKADECSHLDYPALHECSVPSNRPIYTQFQTSGTAIICDKTPSPTFQTLPCDIGNLDDSTLINEIPENALCEQESRCSLEQSSSLQSVNIQQIYLHQRDQSMTERDDRDELLTRDPRRLNSDSQNKEFTAEYGKNRLTSVPSQHLTHIPSQTRNIFNHSPTLNEHLLTENIFTEENHENNESCGCRRETDLRSSENRPVEGALCDQHVLLGRPDTAQVACTQHYRNLSVNQNMLEDKTSRLSTVKITSTQKSTSKNSSLLSAEPVARELVCKKTRSYESGLIPADGSDEINSRHSSSLSADTTFRGILNIQQQHILGDASRSEKETVVGFFGHFQPCGVSDGENIDLNNKSEPSERKEFSVSNDKSSEASKSGHALTAESVGSSLTDRSLTRTKIPGLANDRQLQSLETDILIQGTTLQGCQESVENIHRKDAGGLICEQHVSAVPRLDFNSSSCYNDQPNLPSNWTGEAIDENDGNILSGFRIFDQSEKGNNTSINQSNTGICSTGVAHSVEPDKKFVKKGACANQHQRNYSSSESCRVSAERCVKIDSSHCSYGLKESDHENENSVPVNAGEALCDRVLGSYDLFDDVYDQFVDAEETFDTECQELDARLLKPEVSGGSSGLYTFSDVNSSIESFQDAIDDVDVETRDICDLSLQSDVTTNDEETLSQVSLPISDISDDDYTSAENLDWDNCDLCLLDPSVDGQGDMEHQRRHHDLQQDGRVARCATHRHVQVRDYRTTSVERDKAYQGQRNLAETSLFKDRHSSIQINAIKADMKNESGKHIIKKFIYKTGNDDYTKPHSFVNEPTGKESTIEISNKLSEHGDAIKHQVQSGSKQIQLTKGNISSEGQVFVSEINVQQKGDNTIKTFSVSRIDSDLKRISSNVSKRIAKIEYEKSSSSAQATCSSSSVSSKIETAMTIRNERRRRRQEIQNLKTLETSRSMDTGKSCMQPDTENIQEICSQSETQNNKPVYETTKIDTQNSTLISQISQNSTRVNTEMPENEIITGENGHISNLHQKNETTSFVHRQPKCNIGVEVCSEHVFLTSLDENVTEIVTKYGNLTNQAEVNNNDIGDDDNHHITVNRSEKGVLLEINVLNSEKCLSQQQVSKKVIKVKSLDMDDIQFIDDDDGAASGHSAQSVDDSALSQHMEMAIAPDASFTIMYDASSDEESKSNNHSDDTQVSLQTEHEKNDDQLESIHTHTDGILAVNEDQKLASEDSVPDSPSSECTVVAIPGLETPETNYDDNSKDESNAEEKCDTILHREVLAEQTASKTPENPPKIECIGPVDIDGSDPSSHNNDLSEDKKSVDDGVDVAQVCEESNISVAKALQMERQKMSLSLNEELIRTDKKPTVYPKRSITADNCSIAHFEKSEESTVLSNQLKIPDAARPNIKKSKSFRLDRDNVYPDKDQQCAETAAMMNKRVSDICRSFLNKNRPGVKPPEEPLSSPAPQRKLMKWVNANGKWQRIPIDEQTPPTEYDDRTAFGHQEDDNTDNIECPNASKGAKDNKHIQKLYDQKKELVQTSNIYAMSEEAEDNAFRDNELPKNKETAQISATENKKSIYSNHVHHIDNEEPETSVIYEKLSTNESDVVDIKDNEAQENIADKETHYDENQSEEQSQTASQGVIVTEKSILRGSSSDIQPHVNISINENKERISETNEVRVITKCDQNDTISKDMHKELHVQFDRSEVLKTCIALDTKDVPELKMQDFLLGFGDYQSRKRDLLRFTKREQGELSTTTKPDVDLPKQIPKLKAVKIQEEIYECKPEYMKDSNLQLLETETTSCKDSQENNADLCSSETVTAEAESDFEQETWTLTRVSLRKSNTFSGIDSDKPTFQQGRRGLVEGLSASTKSLDVYSCPSTLIVTAKTPTSPNRIHSKDDSSINEKPFKMRSRSRSVETVQRAPSTQDTKSRSFKMPSMMGAFSGFRRRNKDAKDANTRAVVDDDNEKASHVGGSAEDDERAATKSEKRKLKLPLFMRGDRSKTLPRTKLLSEIVEVEENKDDLSQSPEQQRQQQQQQQKRQQQSHDPHGRLTANPVQRSNKRRSLSLPTGSLAFGDARIVYKNGHFTIETMDGTELDSTRPLGGSNGDHVSQNALNDIYLNGVPPGERSKHQGEITTMGKGDTGEGIHLQRSHRMKRQYGKTTLSKNDSSEYEDVFINYECDIENISPNSQVEMSSGILSDSHSTEVCSNSSRLSEMSLGSSCSEGMEDMDSHEGDSGMQSTEGSGYVDDNGEVKRVAQRARRTSSFKQAQEAGLKANQNNTDIISDDVTSGEMTRRRAGSLDDSQPNDLNKTSANNKATLFQKMIPKRKAFNENLNTFSKQSDSAKEFFAKKMTLKGLFKKNKSESGVGSPVKTMHPVSPPIAAFQRDDDIGSVDSPPSSPFMHADLRRRHTSADIIHIKPQSETSNTDSNSTTPTQERNILIQRHSVSTPTTPSHEVNSFISSVSSCSVASSKEADQVSVSSFSSATSSVQSIQSPPPLDQQPNKPKTPKPVGASPRRNPSTGSVSSHHRSHSAHRTKSVTSLESDHSGEGSVIENDMVHCRCECGQKLGQVKPGEEYSESSHDSSSLSLCQYCRRLAEYYRTSSGLLNSNVDRLRKHSLVGRQNSDEGACVRDRERVRSGDDDNRGHKDSTSRGSYERLCIVSQTDVVSSNSNDSGIQRDDSLHSSNDSLKVTPEGPVRLRRRKSSSPPLERPRSEVAVRWADLDPDECDGGMVTPVRLRQRDPVSRSRPRPKSDFDDNIHLFDELFEEVLDDFVSEGSSFLSDRMRAFGSEVDLQPYCSLRNLYEMRRRDLDKQKNRRMSTPHPIKSRLQRSPRKLQKSTSLVRSNSMPENLDKLHKRRKLNHLLDFHMDTFTRNVMDLDQYSDDSDLSFDHFSLSEKNGSIRSSQGHLTGLDEIEDNLTFAEALWDHITMDPEELAFRAQDVIEILDMSDKDWWFGVIDDREGWFPATFVRLRVNQDQMDEEEELELTMQHDVSLSPKQRRISMFNKNQARTNVVNEIINAEREYVKHLKDVVEGYIVHARKRKEMFPQERIELIFGNLETIYTFAQKFLEQLEQCFDEIPHLSEIGQCFLDNVRGFEIYSDYCNNHPSAIEELKELCRDSKYKHFFEACRLLQELAEIPLEGFLLTPVQKICKYQLQLGELLKYTPPDHADYTFVRDALVAMRKIATLINERKRKMESIEKIAAWQHSVVDWEGEDLLMCSSELIFSGEVNKINTAGWSQERYFFLFDHQLIYCKKEFLKRHLFSYKGRIDIDQCEVIDVPDGKDTQYNVTVKNAWKIHEVHKDKWYLLYAKTAAMKERWLKALQDERKRVQEDRDNDFCVPDHWKQSVLNKVRSQSSLKDKHSSRGSYGPGYQKDIKDFTYSTLPRRVRNQKQDKKKGWFIFGGGKKSKR